MNCSLNGKIESSKIFKKIFVQPASGDAGVAYGACLFSHAKYNNKFNFKKNYNFYLGSRFTKTEIKKYLSKNNMKFKDLKRNIFHETAKLIYDGNIIGWFQGATEFGPRALGNKVFM